MCCAASAWAQISVTDPVNTFMTFQRSSGSVLTDPRWDQQTGQGADDFVGDGTGGYLGFYYKFGQINGVDSLVFRFRFNLLTTQKVNGVDVPKFTGNPRIGVDGDGDGDIDLYFGVSTDTGQTVSISYQNPQAGSLNLSPNTSGLSSNYGTVAGSTANYSYMEVTDGSMYPTKPDQNFVANTDAFLTFAVPFSTFKANLESQLTGVTISTSSFLRFVAFTSTQGNAVNQDVYGMANLQTAGVTRYDDPTAGGFSDFYSVTGQKKPIPEPATVMQVGVLAALGMLVRWRRRESAKAA